MITPTAKIGMYRQMLLIRRIEERVAEMYGEQQIGGFTHLYIGQEAVAVGAISALNHDDYVIGTYRDHGHFLARGGDPNRFMAELSGRDTGSCRGKGGSMHLADIEHYFYGGTGIVGGSMPIASGLALACIPVNWITTGRSIVRALNSPSPRIEAVAFVRSSGTLRVSLILSPTAMPGTSSVT